MYNKYLSPQSIKYRWILHRAYYIVNVHTISAAVAEIKLHFMHVIFNPISNASDKNVESKVLILYLIFGTS